MKRYVWLNLNNGEFSNSWDDENYNESLLNSVEDEKYPGWKLIAYECLNDEKFEFNLLMKLR